MSKVRLAITAALLLVFGLGAGDCDCDGGSASAGQITAASGADSQDAGRSQTGS
jgi:hypothetical protein